MAFAAHDQTECNLREIPWERGEDPTRAAIACSQEHS